MIDINYNKNHTIETKETCIDTFERQADTFVELFVTKEVPASKELTVTHTVLRRCQVRLFCLQKVL